MELQGFITTLAAFVGMVLGLYNLWRARQHDRVRLSVVPKASAYRGTDHEGREVYIHSRNNYDLDHPSHPPDSLSVEVVNLSKFPVTVEEVGLMPRWRRNRYALAAPILLDGGAWPRRLEARDSVVVRFDATKLLGLENIGVVNRAYASTRCGTTKSGRSRALSEFVRIARGVA